MSDALAAMAGGLDITLFYIIGEYEMTDLTRKVKTELLRLGADIVGFGDLNELPDNVREGLPVGISVAVMYPKEVIRGITELPTQEYREWYDKLNKSLDAIVTRGAEVLREMGYRAVAQTRERVGKGEAEINTTDRKSVV